MLRVAPFVGLLYTALVVWFLEGASHSQFATPPLRPWYKHKAVSASPTSSAPPSARWSASTFLIRAMISSTCIKPPDGPRYAANPNVTWLLKSV